MCQPVWYFSTPLGFYHPACCSLLEMDKEIYTIITHRPRRDFTTRWGIFRGGGGLRPLLGDEEILHNKMHQWDVIEIQTRERFKRCTVSFARNSLSTAVLRWNVKNLLYLSDSRKGQMSGTGGVLGLIFARAMMCSKVMSVWVHTSTTHTSCRLPWLRDAWPRLSTCTTIGSFRMASTAPSCPDLEKSRPFT